MNAKEKIIQRLVNKYNEEYRRSQELVSNTSYIDWIKDYIKNKDFVIDDYLEIDHQPINEEDKAKLKQMCLFHHGISQYATENHIYPRPFNCGLYYRIKYNDLLFDIGYTGGLEIYYSIIKAKEDGIKYIDFNDIMTNKKQDNVDYINASLQNISDVINEYYQNGVPIESIEKTVHTTMRYIRSDQARTLKRTK